jgi:hypothetical protein
MEQVSDSAGRETTGSAPWDTVPPSQRLAGGHEWLEPFLVNSYNLRMLNGIYAVFRGRIELILPLLAAWLAREATLGDPATAALAREALSESGLYRHGGVVRGTLRTLGSALGLPRETLRRAIAELDEEGWLIHTAGDMPVPGTRSHEYLRRGLYAERLRDFLWTAQRMDEFKERRPIPASRVGEIERAIRACRVAELPAELQEGVLLPPPDSAVARQAAVVVAGYNLRQIIALRRLLGGDALLGVILGEISHYSHIALAATWPATNWDELKARLGDEALSRARRDGQARACTAHSLALSMDVPAETMRRKLKSLVERGWVERDEDGRYWPPVGLTRHFEVFNRPRFEDFRRSAARARALLAA